MKCVQISGFLREVLVLSTRLRIKGVHSFSIQFQQSNVFLPHQVKCSPITNQRKPYGHFLFIFLIQHLNLFYVKERAQPTPYPLPTLALRLKEEQKISHVIEY